MKKNKIAFIAHPINIETLSIISGWPKAFLNFVVKNNVRSFLENKKPFVFAQMSDLTSKTGSKIDFIAVACPLLPEQMASLEESIVLEKVIDSVRLAKKKGADLAVLGGFTSVVGNEGVEVAKAVDIAVTSGNSFTASLAIKGILEACRIVGLKLEDAKCAVIGATGDIGS